MATLESLIEPFGVSFVYSIPPTALRRMEREIANLAVTEVLTRMIADCEAEADRSFQRNGLDTWAQEFYERADWIKRYLPAPTADEGAETDG